MNVLGRLFNNIGRRFAEPTSAERPETDPSLWDLCLLSHQLDEITTVLPIPPLVVTGGRQGRLLIWDTAAERRGTISELVGHTATILCLTAMSSSFTDDSQLLISGASDGTIRFWCLTTGHLLHTLMEHCAPAVAAVTILPGQGMFASASTAGTIALWQVEEGRRSPPDDEHPEPSLDGQTPHYELEVNSIMSVSSTYADPCLLLGIQTLGSPALIFAGSNEMLHACLYTEGQWEETALKAHGKPVIQLQPLGLDQFCSADTDAIVMWRSATLQPVLFIALAHILPAAAPLQQLCTWQAKYLLLAAGTAFAVLAPMGRNMVEAICLDAHGPGVLVTHIAWLATLQTPNTEPHIISAAEDGSIRLWSMSDNPHASRFPRQKSPSKVASSVPVHSSKALRNSSPMRLTVDANSKSSSSMIGKGPVSIAGPVSMLPKALAAARLTVSQNLIAELLGHTEAIAQLAVIDHWRIVSCAKDGNTIVWLNALRDRQSSSEQLRNHMRNELMQHIEAQLKTEGIQIQPA